MTKTEQLPQVVEGPLEETRIVNRIVSLGSIAGLVDITLATNEFGTELDENGQTSVRAKVCARLRFNVEMAILIRDALAGQIALMTTPAPTEKPN